MSLDLERILRDLEETQSNLDSLDFFEGAPRGHWATIEASQAILEDLIRDVRSEILANPGSRA